MRYQVLITSAARTEVYGTYGTLDQAEQQATALRSAGHDVAIRVVGTPAKLVVTIY